MKKPRVILCDLGNVLIHFDHRIAVRRILPYTDEPFNKIYRIIFDSPATKTYEEGKISSPEFFRRLKKELSLRRLTYKKFTAIWNEIFWENKPMITLLGALKKDYRLHLVSNINKLHYDYIVRKFPGAIGIFDKVILSCEVGHRKPHPRIYRAAIEDQGFSRNQALYTDDRDDLIEKARGMGIFSIMFKSAGDLRKQLRSLGAAR
jgi:HAD superfamily hydrolase (TIGR01509 family)